MLPSGEFPSHSTPVAATKRSVDEPAKPSPPCLDTSHDQSLLQLLSGSFPDPDLQRGGPETPGIDDSNRSPGLDSQDELLGLLSGEFPDQDTRAERSQSCQRGKSGKSPSSDGTNIPERRALADNEPHLIKSTRTAPGTALRGADAVLRLLGNSTPAVRKVAALRYQETSSTASDSPETRVSADFQPRSSASPKVEVENELLELLSGSFPSSRQRPTSDPACGSRDSNSSPLQQDRSVPEHGSALSNRKKLSGRRSGSGSGTASGKMLSSVRRGCGSGPASKISKDPLDARGPERVRLSIQVLLAATRLALNVRDNVAFAQVCARRDSLRFKRMCKLELGSI